MAYMYTKLSSQAGWVRIYYPFDMQITLRSRKQNRDLRISVAIQGVAMKIELKQNMISEV